MSSSSPRPRPLLILLLVLAALAATLGETSAAAQPRQGGKERRELTLSPGEQRILPGEGVDSISAGSPGIIQVRVTEDQKKVVVVGMAPGTTTLLIIMTSGERVDYVVTVSHLQPRRNIRLDIYFVQMARRRGLQLGVGWPGSLGAAVNAQATIDQSGTYSATINATSQVLPRLDFARAQGWAKIMDQARIVVANGDEGTYANSGDVYVRIATGFAADLRQITFGTSIKAKLAYDDVTGRLEGTIKAEVSKLAGAAVDSLPQRNAVSVATTVNLEVGQSLALAGLFSDEEASEMRGLPLLSEIPILGIFFGALGQREERNENVIFIVPTLVGAVSLEQRDRVSEAFDLFRSYEGEFPREGVLRRLSSNPVVKPPPVKATPIVPSAQDANGQLPRPRGEADKP